MVDYTIAAFVLVIFVVAMVIILNRMLYQIAPYQQGIVIVLGSYRKLINPGFNVVTPLATVTKMDLRTQVLEVPRQEVIT
ncbi:MAG: SPFH/Band 7/PHB domain protein, partial [Thermoplasmata archaeon]|nr:SPFH/Band 7/PHB domain protein [Thermoplasmata archaeon]